MENNDDKIIFVWRSENMTDMKPLNSACLKCSENQDYQNAIIEYSMKHIGKVENNHLIYCPGGKCDEDDVMGLDYVPKWCPYLLEHSVNQGN